jgi:DNA excision repair protein ERCC-2
MRELLGAQRLDSDNISIVARKHQVCPFELSFDVDNWVDVVIGDYNYVFDPIVMLHFGEGRAKHVVVIDEAHNLLDHSRAMYSASLAVDDLFVATERVRTKQPKRFDGLSALLATNCKL